jgi:hypothetical protein
MRSPILLLLLAACSAAPTLTEIDPSRAMPGERVVIRGERMVPPLVVRLRASEGDQPEVSATVLEEGPDHVAVELPGTLAPGHYDVVVASQTHALRGASSLLVLEPPSDKPCGNLYRANTKVSALAGEVVVDRFYASGERETITASLKDVASVELAAVALDEDRTCSVITLVKRDGERLRFADDPAVDLSARAKRLAEEIGRPLTRASDVPE